jgi:hypothetical protein
MFKSNYIIVLVFFHFFSCSKKENYNLTTIKVKVENKYSKGDFDNYFSSSDIIALETTKESIIGNIDRISSFDSKFFILDKRSRSITIFNNKGKFLNKICKLGEGPGEYKNLIDFTVDTNRKQLILLTHAPNRVLVYNYEGEFVREIKIDYKDFHQNISYFNNKLLFLTKRNKWLFQEFDIDSKNKINFIEMNENDKFFSGLRSRLPYIIKSNNNINITSLYSDLVYGYDNGNFYPKYKIDFGKHKPPSSISEKFDNGFKGIYEFIKNENYGFGISNFREGNDFITFNFWNNGIVIYSKKLKKAKAYSSFRSPIDQFYFGNYIAHDSNDDTIISIISARIFKKQMSYFMQSSTKLEELPEYLKKLNRGVKSSDNPLLMVYKFK